MTCADFESFPGVPPGANAYCNANKDNCENSREEQGCDGKWIVRPGDPPVEGGFTACMTSAGTNIQVTLTGSSCPSFDSLKDAMSLTAGACPEM